MGKGKICSQVAHASLGAAEIAMNKYKEYYEEWKRTGQKKIVLKVSSEKELIELYEKALKEDLPCYLVIDAGYTQVEPGTKTCLAIGPGPDEKIDKITGHLKLL